MDFFSGVGYIMAEDNKNVSEQIDKGSVLYGQGEPVNEMSIIVKGRVLIRSGYISTIVGSGSVLGANDLFLGIYQADYIACEDVECRRIPVSMPEHLYEFCENNKGYGGYIVTYLSRFIFTLYKAYEMTYDKVNYFAGYIEKVYAEYADWCRENMLEAEVIPVSDIHNMMPEKLPCKDDLAYYIASVKAPAEVQKSYYNVDKSIYSKHIKEQQSIIRKLYEECAAMTKLLNKIAGILVNDYANIYKSIIILAKSLSEVGKDNSVQIKKIEDIIAHINKLDSMCADDMGHNLVIDKQYIKDTFNKMMSGEAVDEATKGAEDIKSLNNAFNQIVGYAGLDDDSADEFKTLIDTYMALKDKYSRDSESLRLRKGISEYFYKVYENVFNKAINDAAMPLAVKLFMDYGFISETIISNEQLAELVALRDNDILVEPCNVFTISQWLEKIRSGERKPSKDDFDLDYEETVREKVKTKEITEEEAKALLRDMGNKVSFEIRNFFRTNHKLVSTNVSTFVPILHEESCALSLAETKLTKYKINSTVRKIMDIDFSLFARQVVYTNEALDISKDYVIKEVYPDVIIMPCYGDKGVMWQDISGRKRDTPARFVFPAFLEKDTEAAMLPVLGKYRWEICRTIQGVKWNDIRDKSLTSEYQDYIQFYRKNGELTEEWKEKTKTQLKNCRNSSKEVFTRDYIEWITRESSGTMRLNKIVREIMATYCPFSVAIRKKLAGQPAYVDAMRRFEKNRDKMFRVSESKCIKLEKAGKKVPVEFEFTKEYYSK